VLDDEQFQCSSASRKFLNLPQLVVLRRFLRFSALQRAENSSMPRVGASTSSTKCFSALQRAENSSMIETTRRFSADRNVSVLFSEPKIPQLCPSTGRVRILHGFSALQRAENSSIEGGKPLAFRGFKVSVLFSEPKIPQSKPPHPLLACQRVSVLFSEPKIPQFERMRRARRRARDVSVLFSEPKIPQFGAPSTTEEMSRRFQCSSASRKFLKRCCDTRQTNRNRVSVLFSEPKIPQSLVLSNVQP